MDLPLVNLKPAAVSFSGVILIQAPSCTYSTSE